MNVHLTPPSCPVSTGVPGYENTGPDEVREVVESSPPDVDGECDVNVRLRTAGVDLHISLVESFDQLPLSVVLEPLVTQHVRVQAVLQRQVDLVSIVAPAAELQGAALQQIHKTLLTRSFSGT